MLRTRDVELAFLGVVPQQITATQLLYRTTDLNDNPQAEGHHGDRADRTRAKGPYTAGVLSVRHRCRAVRCFPSYALRRRAKAPGAVAQFEFFLVAAALAEGWAVSVPDHEGRDGHVGRAL